MKVFTPLYEFLILWRIRSEVFVLLNKDIQFIIFMAKWDISRCEDVEIVAENESYDLSQVSLSY